MPPRSTLSELEKENLPFHVEMEYERFLGISDDINEVKKEQETIHGKLDDMNQILNDVNDKIVQRENTALRVMVKVSGSLIVALIGALGGVIWYLIIQ
jgi:hypothetical protein